MHQSDVVSVCDKPAGAVIVSVKLRANLDVVVILTGKDVQFATPDYRHAYVVPTYGAGVGDAPRRRLHVDVLRSTRSYGNDGDDDSVIINDGTGRSPYTLC